MTVVRIVVEAELQVREMDAWWSANRPAAPTRFAHEFANAVTLLGMAPGAGQRFVRSSIPGIRRLVLTRTRNLVFYVFDAPSDVVWIIAVWGGPRRGEPSMKDPR